MTDAEDDTSFNRRPFATMTLLSNKRFGSPFLDEEGEGGGRLMLDSVFRMELPTRDRKDALCVKINAPAASGEVFRPLNVHFDSRDAQFRRTPQIVELFALLREARCRGGTIAGDFSEKPPYDHRIVDENKLIDAWVALHGSTPLDGEPWAVSVKLEDGMKAGRLGKVLMSGLEPDEIEVLRPSLVGADRPWSDRCGLRCTFTI